MNVVNVNTVQVGESPTGEIIREIGGRDTGMEKGSLAQITIPAGKGAGLHEHPVCEEIYHIVSGKATMQTGGAKERPEVKKETREIGPGDTVLIKPNTPHKINVAADASEPLVMLVFKGSLSFFTLIFSIIIVAPCGLSRSPFRPSDDATYLPYLVPSNAMMAVQLTRLASMAKTLAGSNGSGSDHTITGSKAALTQLAQDAQALGTELRDAVLTHGVATHPKYGKVFAYEVDCYGGANLMDDANMPSLLGLPLVGFVPSSDPTYQNTRKMLLNPLSNPYYFASNTTHLAGIGSPHTAKGNLWPMALITQAMTSSSDDEIKSMLTMLRTGAKETSFMHESFAVSNPNVFTRPWFAWANSYFGALILHIDATRPHLLNTTFTN